MEVRLVGNSKLPPPRDATIDGGAGEGPIVAHHQSSSEELGVRISDDIARLYLETFGKGPMHVETHLNQDVVTTVLRDVFTVAEKLMVEEGKLDSVLSTRMHWQGVTDALFRACVGAATGRRVIAAVSGFDPVHDLASEVFVLEPAPT